MLYKTTIVIWSRFPGDSVELTTLAHEATEGAAYCPVYRSESVADPASDPDWDDTEFFADFSDEEAK
jgi:hypothetical protein